MQCPEISLFCAMWATASHTLKEPWEQRRSVFSKSGVLRDPDKMWRFCWAFGVLAVLRHSGGGSGGGGGGEVAVAVAVAVAAAVAAAVVAAVVFVLVLVLVVLIVFAQEYIAFKTVFACVIKSSSSSDHRTPNQQTGNAVRIPTLCA